MEVDSTTSTPPPTPSSFADRVNYDTVFSDLATHGILFSDADKQKFRDICTRQLKKYDGDHTITTDLGASATNWIFMLFAFVQNIFSGNGSFDLQGIGDRVSGAADKSGQQGKLKMLSDAACSIYTEFKQRGGQFALAAELVTGQKETSADGRLPADMEHSIYRQIRDGINLPAGTSPSLSRKDTGRQ